MCLSLHGQEAEAEGLRNLKTESSLSETLVFPSPPKETDLKELGKHRRDRALAGHRAWGQAKEQL